MSNNMQSLEEYISDLKSDDAEFAEYMCDENVADECISFDVWLGRKRKHEENAAELTHPEASPIVIPQPSHGVLASGARAKAIKKILDCSSYTKATAPTAIIQMGSLINDLTPIKRQWKDANSAKDIQIVFKSFHKWGFKDYKTFSAALEDLNELKENLTTQVELGVTDTIVVSITGKRYREEEKNAEPHVRSTSVRHTHK